MKRILIALILILIIFVNSSKSIFAEGHENNIIDKLIEEAVNNNPELKAFEERIHVFEEKPSQAESLDNPRLKLSIMNLPVDTFRFNQAPMTQKQISIMQKFPFPGKLTLKGNMAEKALEIVKEEYVDKKNNIIMKVKVAYENIIFIYNAIEITERNKDLLREFVKIAETKYTVGKGIQQDVLKAQVELSKIIDRLIVLEQKRQSSVARLNTLLNRPTQMPFTDIGQRKQTSFNLTFENLQKIAEEEQPVLIGLKHLIERFRFSYKLAEKDFYPDFDVGISYGQRDDSLTEERSDFLSGFITINIPIWYKTKESRKVAEEKANMRKATEQYNSMKNEIFFQIKDILTDIERYNQEIELFNTGLIPQSTLSLESAIAGYKVNKVDFITLVNNQITLYNYEIDYYRALTGYEKKIAELEAVVGKRLF
jgi:outer membrane protein TolC